VIDQIARLIVDESKWLPVAMGVAMLAVAILLFRRSQPEIPTRRCVLAAMNMFFAVTIWTMALGHFLAVTTKLALGTLEGSPPVLYLIGVVLIVPAWWLIHHTRHALASGSDGRTALALNAWLAVTLLALGIHNLPLAVPALLNIGYHLHSRRAVGWAIVGMAVVVNVGLFVGALVFMASGQNFEQFYGIESN